MKNRVQKMKEAVVLIKRYIDFKQDVENEHGLLAVLNMVELMAKQALAEAAKIPAAYFDVGKAFAAAA